MSRTVRAGKRVRLKPSPNIISTSAESVFIESSFECNRYSKKADLPFTVRHLVMLSAYNFLKMVHELVHLKRNAPRYLIIRTSNSIGNSDVITYVNTILNTNKSAKVFTKINGEYIVVSNEIEKEKVF